MSDDSSPSTTNNSETTPTTNFSGFRVAAAVVLVGIVALIIWLGPNWVARWQATLLHGRISAKFKENMAQGGTAYTEIRNVAGVDPTKTTDMMHGQYKVEYIFAGRHRDYIIELGCWEYTDDPEWSVDSVRFYSKRKW